MVCLALETIRPLMYPFNDAGRNASLPLIFPKRPGATIIGINIFMVSVYLSPQHFQNSN